MWCLPYLMSSARRDEATHPMLLVNSSSQPERERERVRHLILGSPEDVRATIHRLYGLNYAEQATWSKLLTIPRSGLLITPEQGESV